MSEFNTTILAGQRVLVTGSKKNQQTILDSTEWDSIKAHQAYHLAGDAFDEAVTAFFAPIVEAAEKANAALAESLPKRDDAFVIVLSEGTEGVEEVEPEVIQLGRDAAILRMIEEGNTDRLVWVGDALEILAEESDDETPAEAEAAVDAATDAE